MRLDDKTLRVIGQDLETIGLFDFDLELDGERCVVRGNVQPSASSESSSAPPPLKRSWKFWKSESEVAAKQEPEPVERVYRSDDIDRLVAEGESQRREDRAGRPPPGSIGESLRILGVYCETAGLQPVSVSKHGEKLTYDYLTGSGARQVEERELSELQSFADVMVLKRRR